MATSIRLDDDFVSDVKIHADVEKRSVPKQIEYWAKIGKVMTENPDLPFSFVQDALLASEEVKLGKVRRYERRTKRK
ncbi:TPA: hypothetical protein NG505_000383 [Vibrio parahaemolyticus]|nr:hypothetical protein [Vibrio parahaemolyticus]